MAVVHPPITSFNGGLVSKLALARVDVSRLKFAAEEQTNWTPLKVGPMMLRPGLKYIDTAVHGSNVFPFPFIFSHDETAIIEVYGSTIVVRIDDVVLSRPAVTAAFINGFFVDASGWTIVDTAGADHIIGGNILMLNALALGSKSTAYQAVTINEINVEHAIEIVVRNSFVNFRVGSAAGEDDIIPATNLGAGFHSLAFTPTVDTIYAQFQSTQRRQIMIEGIRIAPAGAMLLPVPWPIDNGADTAVPIINTTQSGDVVYLAIDGTQQHKLERRAPHSWSIVRYEPTDGPFRINPSADLVLTPSATTGNIVLTASEPFWRPEHANSLMRLFSPAQIVIQTVAAEDEFTDPIRVTGVSSDPTTSPPTIGTRGFAFRIQGTWVGTITMERSSDGPDVGFAVVDSFTANTPGVSVGFDDHLDNSILWYRFGFASAQYTSGSALITVNYPGGGGPGVVRITEVPHSISCLAEVLDDLASTNGTRDWQEGEWSYIYGFPTAATMYEGRLWWFGSDRIWASISDAFEAFDIGFLGDAGPISRSIGYGPVERINWALPLARLMLGLQSSEAAIRASTFDAPLTPTNFGIKDVATQGSARTPAVKIDTRGAFIGRSARRLFQLLYQVESQDYTATDLTSLRPDIDSDYLFLAVQRQPDTRIHVVRADGTVDVLLFEPAEEVMAWYNVSTDGLVDRVVVLPGEGEDRVYYYVRRSVNGDLVRFIERMALSADCVGGNLNHMADSYLLINQASSATITGLDRLEAADVIVWANGKDLGTYTISGGTITVTEPVTSAIVGLGYSGRFKSAKLAYGSQMGTALTQIKRLDHLGLILHNTHARGIEFGQSFDKMDGLPLMDRGAPVDPDRVYDEFDRPMIPVPGKWDTDARLCLRATAPRPCTVMGAVVGMGTHDKA